MVFRGACDEIRTRSIVEIMEWIDKQSDTYGKTIKITLKYCKGIYVGKSFPRRQELRLLFFFAKISVYYVEGGYMKFIQTLGKVAAVLALIYLIMILAGHIILGILTLLGF